MRHRLTVSTVFLFLAALAAATAHAQSPASFEALRAAGVLSPGDTVYVTDASGRRSKGPLERLQADSLLVLVDGRPRTYTPADVRRIQRGDSLVNGMLIGLAAGAAAGLITTTSICGTNDDECAVIVNLAVGLPVAAGGLGVGALVDSLIHKTIYRAGAGAGRVGVTPIIGPKRQGVLVAFAF